MSLFTDNMIMYIETLRNLPKNLQNLVSKFSKVEIDRLTKIYMQMQKTYSSQIILRKNYIGILYVISKFTKTLHYQTV